ncbi:MAG: protein-disulfide reductase DsbD domain-containing protein [Verrucomicrobiota bacterium]|nr:protein-disulfide reductase DsbD domain-containing protein [Verrucomicrobiota bacterium]
MRACCLAFLFLLAIAGNLCAQFDDPFGGGQAEGAAKPATTAKLLLSHSEAKPGTTVTAGLELTMDDGWHTYWINPGEAGIATSVEWTLPKGVSAGPIQWPTPDKFTALGSIGYGYHGKTILLVPLTITSDAAPGQATISGKVSWLECKVLCVPRDQSVSAALTIAGSDALSVDAAKLDAVRETLPKTDAELTVKAVWDGEDKEDERSLLIEFDAGQADNDADFFSMPSEAFEVSPESEVTAIDGGRVRIRKTVSKYEGAWPSELAGLAVRYLEDHAKTEAFEVRFSVDSITSGGAGTTMAQPMPSAGQSLWQMLFYAFLGGLILNVMPCVLPVISLKILGFVNQSSESPGRVRLLGLLYGSGVVVSFLALAGVVIGVKSAGSLASWGMQMSNPQFVVLLTVLILLVALNLFGLFEVTLSSIGVAAGSVAGREGAGGAFFNGVLATVLATPCTAPFLAPALGFAFTQTAAVILLIFVTVALGLAFPYVVLSWNPKWLRFLPKPGPWMERFKVAMGFPMLATGIWLFTVSIEYYGGRVLWFGIFLTVIAMAAWVFGEFFQRGTRRRGLALCIAGALALGGVVFGLEGQMQWRTPVDPSQAKAGVVQDIPGGIRWHRWSPEAVAEAREAGQPVLVDFTAKWCLTCIANKKTSLDIESVRTVLADKNIKAFRADYTRRPDDISKELRRRGRAGVPLVLVFPSDKAEQPEMLPELLTPDIVLTALRKAAS